MAPYTYVNSIVFYAFVGTGTSPAGMEISKNGGLQQHSSAVSYCSITSSREKRRRWYRIKVAPVIPVSRYLAYTILVDLAIQ